MEPYRLPRPNAPFVQGNGAPTVEWYNWLRGFENLFNSSDAGLQAQITQIAYALGSPDGTVANIPPIDTNGLPTSTMVVGQNSIVSFGTLADGLVSLSLAGDVATPGPDKHYATDALGVKGWHAAPAPATQSNRITADGNFRVTTTSALRVTAP